MEQRAASTKALVARVTSTKALRLSHRSGCHHACSIHARHSRASIAHGHPNSTHRPRCHIHLSQVHAEHVHLSIHGHRCPAHHVHLWHSGHIHILWLHSHVLMLHSSTIHVLRWNSCSKHIALGLNAGSSTKVGLAQVELVHARLLGLLPIQRWAQVIQTDVHRAVGPCGWLGCWQARLLKFPKKTTWIRIKLALERTWWIVSAWTVGPCKGGYPCPQSEFQSLVCCYFGRVPVSLSEFWQDINRLLPFRSYRVASRNLPLSGP